MANTTNPDNLTGAQIRELEKLNLIDKGMRDKRTNSPVIKSRKIAGPVKGVLRNTAKDDKKDIFRPKKSKFDEKKIKGTARSFFSIKNKPKPKPIKERIPGEQKEMIPLESGKGKGRTIDGQFYPAMAKGGRVGLKAGSKGCKLAMKGKGRAYGKNS